ncbi:mitochondrial import inner membrane translocase subunit tim54 [Puccinia graminis f. sp. tritici]|uniref:Mitochondrial import inner membrane translocase subunit TIM54 n=1 Tax=Puccinia graminis f. sp. tritici TaxID=56615 RepID=A0A5B0RAI2_PUCGR|nr:mitochondrial import inner membrane translocase subunit tim54 [Puccinia graminis f. sp. tritici]KAA1132302.1 mitochondrial import inner membrane translocase subunit tim54 [Puccinia graminis f. sp. tritici]
MPDTSSNQHTHSTAPKPASSINPAFRYLGIPASWLGTDRPRIRLPSAKTSGFLLSCGSLISLYVYDRHQCKKIKEKYLNQIQHLSQSLVSDPTDDGFLNNDDAHWMPRRVTVYGARVPEDVDVDRGTQWFKKYVKPILIAAAIDYTIHNGTTPGALGRKISADIRDQRIIAAAQEKDGHRVAALKPGMPGYREWHAEQHRLTGGTLILGRATLKEYLWGLKHGYEQHIPLDELDDDERFSRQLEEAGIFELDECPGEFSSNEDLTMPEGLRSVQEQLKQTDGHDEISFSSLSVDDKSSPSLEKPSNFFNFFSQSKHTPSLSYSNSSSNQSTTKTLAPTPIPPQAPLLLVPFDHPIGIRWWPLKIYRFFNRRQQVETGAQVAMKLVRSQTRPIEPPKQTAGLTDSPKDCSTTGIAAADVEDTNFEIQLTGSQDLDFLAPEADQHLRRSYKKVGKRVIEERDLFRKELKDRLRKSREETNDQVGETGQSEPLNESQLRQEAFQKEKKWSDQLHGWSIVRKGSGVSWSPEMNHALKIYDSKHQDDMIMTSEN